MRKIILLLVLVFAPTKVFGQDNLNPAEFIMRAVVQKAVENEKLKKAKLEYKRVYKIENLNSQEESTGLSKNEVILISNGAEKLIEQNGRPVRGGTGSGSAPSINFDNALAEFYDYSLSEPSLVMMQGRAYHVINFKPKKQKRTNSDIEEILARLSGTVYIDAEKLYIKRLNAKLTENYKRGWFIYKLGRADIELEQKEFENLFVVDTFKVVDKYYIFGVETFEKQVMTYIDYALVSHPESK